MYIVFGQYHGGTNFGRTAGGPFIATSYDYDAPLDEYGMYTVLAFVLSEVFACDSGFQYINRSLSLK